MIKILAIGNSFSQDATAYLYDIAKCGEIDIKVVNLSIGGCSLLTHWENAKNDLANYLYELNGKYMDRKVSIKEALCEEDWDFITMQQASHDSGIKETYFPYIEKLSVYVKSFAPNAKQLIHKTWAYEIDSTHGGFTKYNNCQQTMYKSLSEAYAEASRMVDAPLILSGDVIQALRGTPEFDYSNGGQSLCRDGFHMHLFYGRYAVAATWYEMILVGNILNNDFIPPDFEISEKVRACLDVIKKIVHRICSES